MEGKDSEGKTLMNLEGTASNTENTAIKHETIGKEKGKEKKTKPRETPNHSTEKWLPYADKEGREYKAGSKIAPIFQETQAE